VAITLTVKYEAGHSHKETWERAEYYCPLCAAKEVWSETGGGDYYVGERYMCAKCGGTFHLPSCSIGRGWQDEQRLAAIRGN
jgi:transposase-like protein